jgi:membrane-bound lytic murein transglycosylase A
LQFLSEQALDGRFLKSRPSRSLRRIAALLFLVLLSGIVAGCGARPLRPLPARRLPDFADDLCRSSLERGVEQSVNFLQNLPPEQQFQLGDRTVSASWLIRSLLSFVAILHQSSTRAELQEKIVEYFDVYNLNKTGLFRHRDPMLVTGYFEPVLDGSLTRNPPFIYPLYRVPPDLLVRQDPDTGAKKVGRLVNGSFVPYWTRAEIEEGNLLAGDELLYLASPIDAFILHVQGSGKIHLRDGSVRNVHYAAANGRPYRSIGRLLVDEGLLSPEEADLPRIREYLADNPGQRDRILHHNESFIFFDWQNAEDPVGNLGQPLTSGRSVAVDQKVYPAGGLGFLQAARPTLGPQGEITGWTPLSRFVLLQDSGSAIAGPKRLDLFWGRGREAEITAGVMRHSGTLYILLEKTDDKNRSEPIAFF